MSSAAQFNTLTGEAWRRSLPAARKRRAGVADRRGVPVQCPVCQRPGMQRAARGGGEVIVHAAGLTCSPAGRGRRS